MNANKFGTTSKGIGLVKMLNPQISSRVGASTFVGKFFDEVEPAYLVVGVCHCLKFICT